MKREKEGTWKMKFQRNNMNFFLSVYKNSHDIGDLHRALIHLKRKFNMVYYQVKMPSKTYNTAIKISTEVDGTYTNQYRKAKHTFFISNLITR